MSFFSLDQILEEEEKIPVVWNVQVQGLGYLKPSSSSSQQSSQNSQQSTTNNTTSNLKSGTKMELPLWIASALTSRGYVKAQPPRFMNTFARRQLEADVQEKNLQAESPYFFDIVDAVATCLEFTNTQIQQETEDAASQESSQQDNNKAQIMDVAKFREDLSAAFVKRYAMILSKCYGHLQKADYSSFVQKLTLLERELYDAGRKGVERYETWKGHVGSYKVVSSAIGTAPFQAKTHDDEEEETFERANKRRAI